MSIEVRKNNHIEICLRENVRSEVSNGFDKYRLIHNALPEGDFDSFSIQTDFLGKTVSAPLLISSMTGGTNSGEQINRNLLEAAAVLNLPFAIGSQRIYLNGSAKIMIPFRKIAMNIPILSNVGAVQLNYELCRDDLLRAVEMIEADALILHLNPLQELIQPGGNTDFSDLLKKIEKVCRGFPVPVIAKEVGWGISAEAAGKLMEAGVSMIDVAGAGGTSWSKVESLIDGSHFTQKIADVFADWGIPTAECVCSIHQLDPSIPIIASGGITNGVEAAKAVWLGADMVGMAARLLPDAFYETSEKLAEEIRIIMMQYKIARFLSTGIEKIA